MSHCSYHCVQSTATCTALTQAVLARRWCAWTRRSSSVASLCANYLNSRLSGQRRVLVAPQAARSMHLVQQHGLDVTLGFYRLRVCPGCLAAHQAARLEQRVEQRNFAARRAGGTIGRGVAAQEVGRACARACPPARARAARRRVLRQVRQHRVPRRHQRVQR